MMILTPLQKKFLQEFFHSYLGEKFFLTGGTALSEFYLGHRKSEDLDFFTLDQELSFDVVNGEVNRISKKLNLFTEHQVSSPSFSRYLFKNKKKKEILKVDLIKDVPVHFGKTKKIKGLLVDSLENIAVGKLLAVFGRADAKDFIDLYFLLKEKKINFQPLFLMAKKKDTGLHEFYLAEMLSRVETIKIFPKTLKPFKRKELVNFFLNLSRKLFREMKPKD